MMAPSSQPAGFRLLTYEGLSLAVRSDSPSHLVWLEEFLAPHFSFGGSGSAGCEIRVEEDARRFEQRLREVPTDPEKRIDCFALDSQVIRLPIWSADDAGVTVFDRDYRVFYSVSRDRKVITLLSAPHNSSLRTPLMRVVRELAMNHCHAAGGLFLHASALASEDGGLIITGHKAAGKSTLLLHLLRTGSARYVANDRVLVDPSSRPVVLRGMPSVVTLREPTLQRFPEVGRHLREARFQQQFTLAEAAMRPPDCVRPWHDGRYGLTPAQLCVLASAPAIAAAQLKAIVFPRITQEPGGIRLRRLEPIDVAEALVPSLLGSGSWKKTSDFFTLQPEGSPGPTAERLTSLCAELAEQVAAYDCFLGLEAYDDEAGTRALLRLTRGGV